MNYPQEYKDFVRFKELEISLYQDIFLNKTPSITEKKEYISLCKKYKYAIAGVLK